MRFIKQQFSLWRIALFIGVAAFAIPIASRVSPTATAVVPERQNNLDHRTITANEDAYGKHRKHSKAAVGSGVVRPQDDYYYERRREYWDRRVESRLDRREEYLDEQTVDDKNADTKDSKDNKAGKDDAGDEEDSVDQDVKQQEDEIERRREYWRKRLDRDW